MKKFAICLAWDYKLPSAEKEIVDRILLASRNINVECILANEYGFILDEEYNKTYEKIGDRTDIEFALHMHFYTSKWDDIFSFFTLWNPVSLLFAWNNFEQHMFNYKSYDDYLSSDSVNPVKHIQNLLHNVNRYYENDIYLFPTASKDNIIKPNLLSSNVRKKLFYCGTAWEKSAGAPVRHEKLFKSLESEGILEIYGPKEANGFKPWEGYMSYIDEIPFDGKSIFKKINECGIVLALSSMEHQKAGVMSNRLFEAAVGGAVIITDDNYFVNKYFGESVIKIDNSGDWETTSRQIIKAVQWIHDNIEKSQEMALKSQQICMEKLLFEQHLKNIFDLMPRRKELLANQLYSKNNDFVDIIVTWDKVSLQDFKIVVENINKQLYKFINVIFVVDIEITQAVSKIVKNVLKDNISYKIISEKIFNINEIRYSPTYRIMTTGQMLSLGLEKSNSSYITFMKSNDIWFSDHITTLKRTLENDNSKLVSHSSLSSEIIQNNQLLHYAEDYYKLYTITKTIEFATRESLSMLMIKKEFLESICLDSLLYIDYLDFHLFILTSIQRKQLVFTNRKTCLKKYFLDEKENPQDFPIVQYKYQISYIKSFFVNTIDFPRYEQKDSSKIYEQKVDDIYIHHLVKGYILKQIKNPINVFMQLIKDLIRK